MVDGAPLGRTSLSALTILHWKGLCGEGPLCTRAPRGPHSAALGAHRWVGSQLASGESLRAGRRGVLPEASVSPVSPTEASTGLGT